MSKDKYKKKLRVQEIDPDSRKNRKRSDLKKRVGQFIRREKLEIIPAPDRVLIKITDKQIQDLISKEITLEDGTKKRLFFEPILFDKSFERSFQQNVSVGEAVNVGTDVHHIEFGDILILDYLTGNLADHLIGFFNKDQLISVLAETTYHKTSSVLINGRRAWAKGDFDNISMILGVVRGEQLIPFDPYIFLQYEPDYLKIVSIRGEAMRSPDAIVQRRVIASHEGCIYKCGDQIKIKRDDWFDREINGYKIAICFRQDVICKSTALNG